jgi:hypothetical protein
MNAVTLLAIGFMLVLRSSWQPLFYADHKAIRISDDRELIDVLAPRPSSSCTKRDLERIELLKRISYVIELAASDVFVAPRK